MPAKFEMYKDAKGEIRWKLWHLEAVAPNGQTIATSGEGYKSKDSARQGIESVKKNAPTATVEDKTG